MPDTRNNGNSRPSTRAKNKNNSKNYDRLYPFVKKGGKEEIKRAAAAAEENLNEYSFINLSEDGERRAKSHGPPWGIGRLPGRLSFNRF